VLRVVRLRSRSTEPRDDLVKVVRDPAALCAGIVLRRRARHASASVHFRFAGARCRCADVLLDATQTQPARCVAARQIEMRETKKTITRKPLAFMSLKKETFRAGGNQCMTMHVSCATAARHLSDPQTQ